jgi:nicotinamidase-related amidase
VIADPALVLIDFQNDFCKPGFAVATETDLSHVQPVVERAGDLLARYRESGRTPILVRTELPDEALGDGWAEKIAERPFDHICAPGSAGVEFVPELGVAESDRVVTKTRYSSFYGTDLEDILSARDVTDLVVAGVSTNVCVESTVRAAYDRGYRVTVVEDCTGAASRPDLHEPSLDGMDSFFADVRPAGDVRFDPL